MAKKGSRFGDAIRTLRRVKGKTLQEMADCLEVSVSYYSEVELGKRPAFKAEKIRQVAEKLGGRFEELFAFAWEDRQVIAFNTKDCDPKTLGLLQSFARGGISQEKLDQIEQILNA